MGNPLSLDEVPEDTEISMTDLRTFVKSETGWECEVLNYEYFEDERIECRVH